MMPRWFASVITISLMFSAVRAENWPQFRGPTGQGIVRDGKLPVEWGKEKNVVWKQPIPGIGWSSPVVQEGRVYLTTSVSKDNSPTGDQSLQALCLDAGTGKILWQSEVFHQDGSTAPRIHGKNSHASPTPLVHEHRLYVHFGHQGTACLDLSGKVLWRNTHLKYAPVHGNGGTLILAGEALVFSGDGADKQFLVALDRNNGKVLWKTDRNTDADRKFSFSTPLLITVTVGKRGLSPYPQRDSPLFPTVNGQEQIISPGSDMVGAYDPRTGREIWQVRYTGYSVIPRPVYGQGLVFVCTGYDSPGLLAIRPDGRGDVTKTHVAWSTRKAVPHTPSLLLVGEELYMVSDGGIATCLDAKTGRVHWQQRIGGNYSASPLYADGKIYFQSEQGTGVVVKAGKQFELLAKNALEERTLASYAAAGGALFIRTEGNLYRFESR